MSTATAPHDTPGYRNSVTKRLENETNLLQTLVRSLNHYSHARKTIADPAVFGSLITIRDQAARIQAVAIAAFNGSDIDAVG